MENYFQIHWKNFLLNFKKGYDLKGCLVHCVPVYSPRVSFYLTPLSTAFEKVCVGIFDPYYRVFFFQNTHLKSFNEFLLSMKITVVEKFPA